MLSVHDAAKRLGVSDRRVRALIDSGRLRAERLGRAWMIDPNALASVHGERLAGRPLGPEAAWAELLGEREAPDLDASMARFRYRGRSERFYLVGPDMRTSVNDQFVRQGGWAAAEHFDQLLDDDRSKDVVVYLGASSYDAWVSRHWLVPSSAQGLVAHLVPDEFAERVLAVPDHFVPARVSAVDIAEEGGVRSIEAALRIWAQ